MNLDFKNGRKINFRIITKNFEADSKIGSHPKIDFTADGTQESHPTAWELRLTIVCSPMCLYRTLKQVDFHGDSNQFQASLDFDEGKILI